MLPKKKRLSSKAFLTLLKQSSIARSENFSLRYKVEKTRLESHFAVVTPKNVCRSAVDRNKLRRRVYSAIAKSIPVEKINLQAIVFAQKGAGDLAFKEIVSQMGNLLLKVR